METKYCKYCDTHKPLDRFNKGRAKCKDCLAADKRRTNKGILLEKEEPLSKPCTKCGITRDKAEFHPKKNICMGCHKEYMANYRKKNRAKISKQVQDWKDENREHYNEKCRERYNTEEGKAMHKARVTKTWRSWLSHIISALASHAKKPGKRDPKSGPKRDFDIDLDYVVSIGEEQGWKCALTGIPMVKENSSMYAASIDRIDSEKGHVKGNIQIVCQCVNMMKRHHTQEEAIEFFQDLVALARLEESPVRRIYTVDISKCKNSRELELVKNAAQQVMDQIDDGPTNGA